MNRRAQVAIWVILAIVLVASIILFFTLSGERDIADILEPGGVDSINTPSFMQTCTEEYVLEAVDIMLPHGGFVVPENTIWFNNSDVEYLCENIGFYEPCVNQHPLYIRELEEEIRSYIFPKVGECFNELEDEIEKRGGEVEFGNLVIDVNLGMDRIFVTLDRDVEIEKKDTVRTYESFEVVVESPLYNLAVIAVEIAAQEAQYCYFENVGYGVYYPRYKVGKYAMSAPTKIYTIHDRNTGKEMMIAIRSCAMPAGI